MLYPVGGFCVLGRLGPMTVDGYKRKLTVVFSAEAVGYTRVFAKHRHEEDHK